MDSEDWEAIREARQVRREAKKKDNLSLIYLYQGDLDYDFTVEVFGEHQFRLTGAEKKRLDFWPQRGRATWVGTNKFFTISNIEQFIMKHFKAKK